MENFEVNALDIEKAFEDSFNDSNINEKKKEENRSCFPYSNFNACRNLGKIYCKIVPGIIDGSLRIYKSIDPVYMGSIPFKKDDGNGEYFRTVRVTKNNNYKCELSPEQIELNNNLISELDRYNQLSIDNGSQYAPIRVKRLTLMFAAIRRTVSIDDNKTDYLDPNVTCIYFTSKGFSKTFHEAIKAKTEAKESNEWLKDYFSRNEGECRNLVIIQTTRPEIKYEHSVLFDEFPGLKFKLKKEDLDAAYDLDEAFINTKSYDTENMRVLYDRVHELNESMTNNNEFSNHEFGGENKNLS